MTEQDDRRDYKEIVDAIKSLSAKIDHNQEIIIAKFDKFKDETCVPTRMKFSSDIKEMKVKQGITAWLFGSFGGAATFFLKYLLRR